MLANKLLFFETFIIYFISYSDASIKLIPNGTRTITKNGAKHEVTTYIVVPEDHNDSNLSKGHVYHSKTYTYGKNGEDHIAAANYNKKSERSGYTFSHSTLPKKTITKYRVTYKTTGVKDNLDNSKDSLINVDGEGVKDDHWIKHTIYQPESDGHVNLNNIDRGGYYGEMVYHTPENNQGSTNYHQTHSHHSQSIVIPPKSTKTYKGVVQYQTSSTRAGYGDQEVYAGPIVNVNNEEEIENDDHVTVKLHKVDVSKNDGLNINNIGENTMKTYHWSYKYPNYEVNTGIDHKSVGTDYYSGETDEEYDEFRKNKDKSSINKDNMNLDSSIASGTIANLEDEAYLKYWESKYKHVDSTTSTDTDLHNGDILSKLLNKTPATSQEALTDELMEQIENFSEPNYTYITDTERPDSVITSDLSEQTSLNEKGIEYDQESKYVTSAQPNIYDTLNKSDKSESTSIETPVVNMDFMPDYSLLALDEKLIHGSNMEINTDVPVPGNIGISSYYVDAPSKLPTVSYSEKGLDDYLSDQHEIEYDDTVIKAESIHAIRRNESHNNLDPLHIHSSNTELPDLQDYPIQGIMTSSDYEIDDSSTINKIATSTDKSLIYTSQPDWYPTLSDKAEALHRIYSTPDTVPENVIMKINSDIPYDDFGINHSGYDNIQYKSNDLHLNRYEDLYFPAGKKSTIMPKKLTIGIDDDWNVHHTELYPGIKSNVVDAVPVYPENKPESIEETVKSVKTDNQELYVYSDLTKPVPIINSGNNYLKQNGDVKHLIHGKIPDYKYHIGRSTFSPTHYIDYDYVDGIQKYVYNDKIEVPYDTEAYSNFDDTSNFNIYRDQNPYIQTVPNSINSNLIKKGSGYPTSYIPLETHTTLDGTYVRPVRYLHYSLLLNKYPRLNQIIHGSQVNGYNYYGDSTDKLNGQQHDLEDKIYKYIVSKKVPDTTHRQYADMYELQKKYILQNPYNIKVYETSRPKIAEIPVISKDHIIVEHYVNNDPYYSGNGILNHAVDNRYITDPSNYVYDGDDLKQRYNIKIDNKFGVNSIHVAAIERKYNLNRLKQILEKILRLRADTFENLTSMYNAVLNYIVYLHSNSVNEIVIEHVIREVKHSLYTKLIKARVDRRVELMPYNDLAANEPCWNCYSNGQ